MTTTAQPQTSAQLSLDGSECQVPRHDPRCIRLAEEFVHYVSQGENLHTLVDPLRRWELVETMSAMAALVLEARAAAA